MKLVYNYAVNCKYKRTKSKSYLRDSNNTKWMSSVCSLAISVAFRN